MSTTNPIPINEAFVSSMLLSVLHNPLTTLSSLLLAYYISTSIYCLTLHPLASFPGPFFSAFSRIPFWYISLRGWRLTWVQQQHAKYGPVYRLSPNELSYTGDGEAWDIHRHKKGKKENPKAPEFFMRPPNGVPNLMYAPQKDHSRVRSIFAPAFSERALRAQEPLFIDQTSLLLSKLSQLSSTNPNTPIEMGSMLNFTTFDIMGDLAFGQPLGLLDNIQYSPWVASVFNSVKVLLVVQIIEFYPLLRWLFDRVEPKVLTDMKMGHWNHTVERVDQRLARGPVHPDIWSLVMEEDEEGNEKGKLTLGEMHTNAELFMLAGSETTATTLTGIMFHLLTNPEKMERLTSEIRTTFQSEREIGFDRLAPLSYLNACLQEILRIYPPVAVGMPRYIPSGGQIIMNHYLPAETRVQVQHYTIYHSASNFLDPDTFIPERWLGDEKYANDNRTCLQPFGLGPRSCLGQNMAMHEMRIILARLLWKFDFILCEKSREWDKQRSFLFWERKPLLCLVSERMSFDAGV